MIFSVFYLSIENDNHYHPTNESSEQLKKYISNIGKTSHNPFDIFNSSLEEHFSSRQTKRQFRKHSNYNSSFNYNTGTSI